MKNNTQRGRRGLSKQTVLIIATIFATCTVAGGESQIIIEEGVVERAYVEPTVIVMDGRPTVSNLRRHSIYYTDGTGKNGLFSCPVLAENDISSMNLPKDRSDPKWVRYSAEASRILDECTGWKQEMVADFTDIKIMEVFISDGKQWGSERYSGIRIDSLSVAPTPASCDTKILSQMDFGTVMAKNPGVTGQAIARLAVECNKTSRIDFTVNDGEPLVNEDGSKIIFSIWSPADAPAGVPTEIQVRGTMLSSPTRPGSYQWYVPILFSYE